MANIVRRAKSGGYWTRNDLTAYNVRVVFQDATTFFGVDHLPDPAVSNEILLHQDHRTAESDKGYIFLLTLDLATDEEPAVYDFAVALLRACGYLRRGRVDCSRKDLPLFICGETRHAKADVCILDENLQIILLIQKDKGHKGAVNPEAQLIAKAIAVFNLNNSIRERTLGVPPIQSTVIPGITLKGTAPIFYRMPITTALVDAVAMGTYPEQETIVYAHIPDVPRPDRRWSEGMKPLDSRRKILSCYEAFKQFVN